MKLSLCKGVLSYSFTLISPDVVLIRTIVFSLPRGALQEIKSKRIEKKIKCLATVFMKIEIWLITFCKSDGKDI